MRRRRVWAGAKWLELWFAWREQRLVVVGLDVGWRGHPWVVEQRHFRQQRVELRRRELERQLVHRRFVGRRFVGRRLIERGRRIQLWFFVVFGRLVLGLDRSVRG